MVSNFGIKFPTLEEIGQVEVSFLGESREIGRIDGNVDKALRLVKRFDTDARERTRAVSAPTEPIQAKLMARVPLSERLTSDDGNVNSSLD